MTIIIKGKVDRQKVKRRTASTQRADLTRSAEKPQRLGFDLKAAKGRERGVDRLSAQVKRA